MALLLCCHCVVIGICPIANMSKSVDYSTFNDCLLVKISVHKKQVNEFFSSSYQASSV